MWERNKAWFKYFAWNGNKFKDICRHNITVNNQDYVNNVPSTERTSQLLITVENIRDTGDTGHDIKCRYFVLCLIVRTWGIFEGN